MGDIPEGEIAVKFGLDKEGEVQMEGTCNHATKQDS